MSAGVEIKVISPNDSSIYARSANSRLISSDIQVSSQSITSKAVQIASGKRRGYDAKNDSSEKKSSERRVASHMPKYEYEEPVVPSVLFEAVEIPEEAPVVVDLRATSPDDVTPLSPKLQSEYGKSMIQLNISPPIQRKAPSSKRRQAPPSPPKSNRTVEPLIVETVSTQEIGVEEVAPKSSRRRSVEKPKSTRSSRRRQDALPLVIPAEEAVPIVEPKPTEIIEAVVLEAEEQPTIEIVEEKPQSAPRLVKVEIETGKSPLSPQAERRVKSSPRKSTSRPKSNEKPTSNKSDGGRSTKVSPPSPTSGNVHYDNHSVISPQPVVDSQGADRHSNRRADLAARVKSDPRPLITAVMTSEPKIAAVSQPNRKPTQKLAKPVVKAQPSPRPKSPHRVSHEQPTIRIGGREVTSRDYGTSDSSSARTQSRINNDDMDSPPSDSSTTDTTTHRKIKSRQDGLEKGLKEQLGDEEFCPEDDEHLDLAIKIALEESQKQSVQEALDAGHDLNAEVLKHLHRPNAVPEVIEKLVSQRRERIHEKQSSQRKAKEQAAKSKARAVAEQNKSPNKAVKKPLKKPTVKAKVRLSAADDDAEEDDQPEIETVEEIFTQPTPKIASKKKTTSKRKPIVIEEIQQEDEVVDGEANHEEDAEIGVMEEVEVEKNVKLPKATRAAKASDDPRVQDVLTGKSIMRQKDDIYDPVDMKDEPDDEDPESIGDEVYEESSEDDDRKMTINEKKDEMFYRFKLVREAYPGISLPRITRKMKLAKMVRYYEHIMSRIKLKTKTNNFKVFLIVGFLAMQFGGKKLGLNTDGFTVNQMTSMKRYERMLREFGESDWSSIGVDLPVTVRLPFFMLVNMGIFVIAKWIFQKTKKDYSVQFHKLYAQLTGGDDYVFLKDEAGDAGMAAGGGEEDGGGGIFGMLKPILSMFGGLGGGGGGGGDDDEKPKRGEAAGPTYSRRKKKAPAE